ncbi:hypothetical protein HDV00_011224, partial [Rhizophlyctis rosea]
MSDLEEPTGGSEYAHEVEASDDLSEEESIEESEEEEEEDEEEADGEPDYNVRPECLAWFQAEWADSCDQAITV